MTRLLANSPFILFSYIHIYPIIIDLYEQKKTIRLHYIVQIFVNCAVNIVTDQEQALNPIHSLNIESYDDRKPHRNHPG